MISPVDRTAGGYVSPVNNSSRITANRWERWFILFLFFFSLSLRLIYLSEIHHNPFFEHPTLDALYHDNWAQSIASGNLIGDEVFFRAPFYPYCLGLIYAIFGHNYLAPRLIQHTLGALAVVLLYLLARRLFGRLTAIVASLFAATYAILIYFEGELLFDSLLVFLGVLWFLLLYHAKDKPSFSRWFLSGLVFGIICITRPLFLPLFVFIVGWQVYLFVKSGCFRHWRNAIYYPLAFTLGTFLTILPVTIRNWVVGQDLVLIASQGGINFYIGNNPIADGHTSQLPGLGNTWENRDLQFIVERVVGHTAKPSEISSYWYKQGWQFIKSQPDQFLRLTLKKLYLFWNKYEIPNNQDLYFFWQYSHLMRLLPTGFWLIGPLGLTGMLLAWRAKRARFLVIFCLFYTAVIVAFFVCDRFRLPVIPFLSIFAAYTVVFLGEKIKALRSGFAKNQTAYSGISRMNQKTLITTSQFIGTLLILLVFGGITNSNLYRFSKKSLAQNFHRLGNLELRLGNYAKAIEYFKQVATAQPDFPGIYLNWGVAEWKLGQPDRAAEKFHEELLYQPNNAGALTNLSALYRLRAEIDPASRLMDSAIFYAEKALRIKPYSAPAYVNLALAYNARSKIPGLTEKNLPLAESTLLAGQKMCGKDFLYGEYLLAGVHLLQGKNQIAENEYRSLLQRLKPDIQPSYDPEFAFTEESRRKQIWQVFQARLLYGLGHIFVIHGQLDSAVYYFQAATRTWPKLSDVWVDLGIGLLHLNRFSESDSAFQRALQLNPNNHFYWFNYGLLLASMKRLPEAKAAFEKCLKMNPDFAPAREKLTAVLNLMR